MFREFLAAHLGLLYELSGVLVIAFITAFTVGFGDVAPQSRGARVVTVLLALFGVLLVGVAVAVAVHALDIVLTAGGPSAPPAP
jgi:hypothetical protein